MAIKAFQNTRNDNRVRYTRHNDVHPPASDWKLIGSYEPNADNAAMPYLAQIETGLSDRDVESVEALISITVRRRQKA
jgi:hypothetical protein